MAPCETSSRLGSSPRYSPEADGGTDEQEQHEQHEQVDEELAAAVATPRHCSSRRC